MKYSCTRHAYFLIVCVRGCRLAIQKVQTSPEVAHLSLWAPFLSGRCAMLMGLQASQETCPSSGSHRGGSRLRQPHACVCWWPWAAAGNLVPLSPHAPSLTLCSQSSPPHVLLHQES